MPKISDLIKGEINEDIGIPSGAADAAAPDRDELENQSGGFAFDLGILKTETGDGEIEDYLTHPLNPTGSKGIAQMIRGATGFAGNLRFALLDIVMGYMNFTKERSAAHGTAYTVRE